MGASKCHDRTTPDNCRLHQYYRSSVSDADGPKVHRTKGKSWAIRTEMQQSLLRPAAGEDARHEAGDAAPRPARPHSAAHTPGAAHLLNQHLLNLGCRHLSRLGCLELETSALRACGIRDAPRQCEMPSSSTLNLRKMSNCLGFLKTEIFVFLFCSFLCAITCWETTGRGVGFTHRKTRCATPRSEHKVYPGGVCRCHKTSLDC